MSLSDTSTSEDALTPDVGSLSLSSGGSESECCVVFVLLPSNDALRAYLLPLVEEALAALPVLLRVTLDANTFSFCDLHDNQAAQQAFLAATIVVGDITNDSPSDVQYFVNKREDGRTLLIRSTDSDDFLEAVAYRYDTMFPDANAAPDFTAELARHVNNLPPLQLDNKYVQIRRRKLVEAKKLTRGLAVTKEMEASEDFGRFPELMLDYLTKYKEFECYEAMIALVRRAEAGQWLLRVPPAMSATVMCDYAFALNRRNSENDRAVAVKVIEALVQASAGCDLSNAYGQGGRIYKDWYLECTPEERVSQAGLEKLDHAIEWYNKGFEIYSTSTYLGINTATLMFVRQCVSPAPSASASKTLPALIIRMQRLLSKAVLYWDQATLLECYTVAGNRNLACKQAAVVLRAVSSSWQLESTLKNLRLTIRSWESLAEKSHPPEGITGLRDQLCLPTLQFVEQLMHTATYPPSEELPASSEFPVLQCDVSSRPRRLRVELTGSSDTVTISCIDLVGAVLVQSTIEESIYEPVNGDDHLLNIKFNALRPVLGGGQPVMAASATAAAMADEPRQFLQATFFFPSRLCRSRFCELLSTAPCKEVFASQIKNPLPDSELCKINGKYDARTAFIGAVIAGRYRIVKAIDSGGVGHGFVADDLSVSSVQTNATVFLKTFKCQKETKSASTIVDVRKELNFLKHLRDTGATQHENVVHLYGLYYGPIVVPLNKQEGKLHVAVYEFCSGGEFFSYLCSPGADRFSEPLARYYFRQLVAGVQHLHRNNVFHRDLKLENLVMDSNYTLKIADFGHAVEIAPNPEGMVRTKSVRGTNGYQAPEIFRGAYHPGPVDIWSCGVILFFMVGVKAIAKLGAFRKFLPTVSVLRSEPKQDGVPVNLAFWQYWEQNPRLGQHKLSISPELKHLFNAIFNVDPSERWSWEQICSHPWMNETPLSHTEAVADMKARYAGIQEATNRFSGLPMPPRRGAEYVLLTPFVASLEEAMQLLERVVCGIEGFATTVDRQSMCLTTVSDDEGEFRCTILQGHGHSIFLEVDWRTGPLTEWLQFKENVVNGLHTVQRVGSSPAEDDGLRDAPTPV